MGGFSCCGRSVSKGLGALRQHDHHQYRLKAPGSLGSGDGREPSALAGSRGTPREPRCALPSLSLLGRSSAYVVRRRRATRSRSFSPEGWTDRRSLAAGQALPGGRTGASWQLDEQALPGSWTGRAIRAGWQAGCARGRPHTSPADCASRRSFHSLLSRRTEGPAGCQKSAAMRPIFEHDAHPSHELARDRLQTPCGRVVQAAREPARAVRRVGQQAVVSRRWDRSRGEGQRRL